MDKNYFTFYRSYYEAVKDTMSKEERTIFYEAIMEYMLNDNLIELKGTPKMAFNLVLPTMSKSKALSNNGKKGGAPIGNKNAQKH